MVRLSRDYLNISLYVLVLCSLVILIILIRNANKEKRRKNKKVLFQHLYEKIVSSKVFKKILYKETGKRYKKLQRLMKSAGYAKPNPNFILLKQVSVFFIVFFSVFMIDYLLHKARLSSFLNMSNLNMALFESSNGKFSFKFILYFASGLLSMMLVEGSLWLKYKLRRVKGKKEVVLDLTYTLILLKAGRPVKDILKLLLKQSKIYTNELELALLEFSNDNIKALQNLDENIGDKMFNKVVYALTQKVYLGEEAAIKYLEVHREFIFKLDEINNNKKNTRKNAIGIVSLGFPLLVTILIIIFPWLVYLKNITTTLF